MTAADGVVCHVGSDRGGGAAAARRGASGGAFLCRAASPGRRVVRYSLRGALQAAAGVCGLPRQGLAACVCYFCALLGRVCLTLAANYAANKSVVRFLWQTTRAEGVR